MRMSRGCPRFASSGKSAGKRTVASTDSPGKHAHDPLFDLGDRAPLT